MESRSDQKIMSRTLFPLFSAHSRPSGPVTLRYNINDGKRKRREVASDSVQHEACGGPSCAKSGGKNWF